MSFFDKSQMYAELPRKFFKDEYNTEDFRKSKGLPVNDEQRIELHELGECRLIPDIVKSVINCCSVKPTMDAAKQSVSRRVDYILQTLRNHHVKPAQYKVHSRMTSCDDGFKSSAEVVLEFADVETFEAVANYLVEKLEHSISISGPLFLHSTSKLESARRTACLRAVRNARAKALSIAQFMNQTLGSPLLVREEDRVEQMGLASARVHHASTDEHNPESIHQQFEDAIIVVTVKVFVIFNVKDRKSKAST